LLEPISILPKVSIIIPTYNRAALLPQAIESAKHAGGDPEVIVVDNGSTDATQELCRTISGIRYIRLYPNVRQARARNEGIKVSTGEFLTFLDDDDQRLPNSLEAQIKLFESTPDLGFVYGPVLVADQNCLPTGAVSPAWCNRGDIFWRLFEGNFIHLHSVVVSKKLINEVGLFDPELVGAEDWMLLLRLSEHHAVDAVEEPVAVYRHFTRTSGQTSSNRIEMCRVAARTLQKGLRLQRSREAPKKKRREVRRRFFQTLGSMLVEETVVELSEGRFHSAVSSYATALRLAPSQTANFYVLKRLLSTIRWRKSKVASNQRPLTEQQMQACITVGVPIYRGGLFLEESLASVRDQTYPNIEVIMSLDGPDPECEDICRRFLTDSRFRLVIQPLRLGWMPHTNWLMSQVQTEFWHLQEQDDVIEPAFLETLARYASEHPDAAVVFSDLRTFGTTDAHMEMSSVVGSPFMRQMKLIYEHFPGVAPLGLIRTEALRMSGGLQANEFENFAADTALMAGLARWGELHRLPQELYRKRVHPQSTCAAWWDWAMDRRFKAWQAHCLEMLRQALLIDVTAHDRRLLWLAVIERLVSPRAASHFLPIPELTAAERADMLDSFLARARTPSIDITGSLVASWDEIDGWTRGYYWVDANREISGMEKLSRETASKISLEVSAVSQEARVSAVFWLDAKVTNRTNETLYPAAPFPVRLAYHWLQKATRQMVVFEGKRTELFPLLEANATARYPMIIIAPSQPGEYILQTTIVQDGVFWFEDMRPDIVQEFTVSVTA